MTATTTGPSTWRVTRAIILVALTIGFAVAFLYDGYQGYAKDNVRQFLRSIGKDASEVGFDPTLTDDRGKTIAGKFRPGEPLGSVEAALGRPQLEADGTSYYFGRGGRVELRRDGGRVGELAWFGAAHSEMDQTWQRWIGYILAAAGIAFCVRLVRALTDRVVIDERGIHVGRRRPIALSDVTGIDTGGFDTDGVAIVRYERGGVSQALQLDSWDYKSLPGVLDALRERAKLEEEAPSPVINTELTQEVFRPETRARQDSNL